MELSFKWDDASSAWIDTLPQRLNNSLRSGAVQAIKSGLAEALRLARSSIPTFEYDAVRALGLFGLSEQPESVRMSLGFVRDSVYVDESDVWDKAQSPYNYAWAKESSDAAKPHRVWLYNPSTGGSTKNRAKLVRWLKSKGGKWDQLPDAPTKETWNAKRDESFPPPYVDVDPSKTATDYITKLIADSGDPLASLILDNPALDEALRRAWEV
jgi:hypothetical protein